MTASSSFPLAAEYRRNGHYGRDGQVFPVSILEIDGLDAICLCADGSIERLALWKLRVIEPMEHPARQAQLRAHVIVSQPGYRT